MWTVRVGGVRALASALQQAILPALCVSCDAVLAGEDRGLCGACRGRLLPLSAPCCPRCGQPGDSSDEPCLGCVGAAPPQQGTVLWGEYDGVLRRAVLALKHRRHDELARPLGRRLAAAIVLAPWAVGVTSVAPVPSHRIRRLRRGGCAAALLAAEVATALGRPRIDALRRHGLGRQAGRSRAKRLRLPRGSFSARRRLAGQRVLLVDDVSTTGTTLRRAAETLLAAGADAVYCAALAHAADPRRI